MGLESSDFYIPLKEDQIFDFSTSVCGDIRHSYEASLPPRTCTTHTQASLPLRTCTNTDTSENILCNLTLVPLNEKRHRPKLKGMVSFACIVLQGRIPFLSASESSIESAYFNLNPFEPLTELIVQCYNV